MLALSSVVFAVFLWGLLLIVCFGVLFDLGCLCWFIVLVGCSFCVGFWIGSYDGFGICNLVGLVYTSLLCFGLVVDCLCGVI